MPWNGGAVKCSDAGRRTDFGKYPCGTSEVLSVVEVISRLDGYGERES